MARHYHLSLTDDEGVVIATWTITDDPKDDDEGADFLYPFHNLGVADLADSLNRELKVWREDEHKWSEEED